MDDDTCPKKATIQFVDGTKPRGQPRKRLCDVICADKKSLNLRNEDINNRALWRSAVKPKMLIQRADILPAQVDSGL